MENDLANEGVEATTLVKTQTAWDGSVLPDYPMGKPELIIERISFPPHHVTTWHYHSVINAGFILKGELTIVCKDGKEKTFHAGDAIVECVGEIHRGENRSEIANDIVMFYDSTPGETIETNA